MNTPADLGDREGSDRLRAQRGADESLGIVRLQAINDSEPPVLNEPGLFLISPDASVYDESILSMPAGRPRLDDLLGGIAFWTEHAYPARGGD